MAKIVSGGQTGVDRGALAAALKLGFPYGGMIPHGRKAEDGVVPADRTGGNPMTEEQENLIGREFRHFKGKFYRIEGFARDSETQEEMVVYRTLYGDYGLWVRPAKMFFETIERDGRTMKRFELIEEQKP